MDERVATGDGDSVGLAILPENGQVVFDGVERLVALGTVFAIAALAVQITGLGDFEPGNGVVRQVPGEPIVSIVVERERHENFQQREFEIIIPATLEWLHPARSRRARCRGGAADPLVCAARPRAAFLSQKRLSPWEKAGQGVRPHRENYAALR